MSDKVPSMDEIAKKAIRKRLGTLQTILLARIVAYNSTLQMVTIQPVAAGLTENAETGELESDPLPSVSGVPVGFLGGGIAGMTWSVTGPLEPGDWGLYIVCKYGIDEWKANGNASTVPQDPRRFDIADGIFVPMSRPFSDPLPAEGAGPAVDGSDNELAIIRALGGLLLSSGAASAGLIAIASMCAIRIKRLEDMVATHLHTAPMIGVTGPPEAASVLTITPRTTEADVAAVNVLASKP